jgi:PKD domain
MPRRLVLSLIGLALPALTGPASASAAPAKFFPADAIDGPSADVLRVGDVDVARDGSGAVAYVKRDGGVEHVFVSRLVNGAWQAPERLDPGLGTPAADPAVAASDGGKLVIAFTSGGQLFYVVRPVGANAWPAPVAGPAPAATPSVDMSINGIAYLVWAGGGDVHGARLERNAATFTQLPAPLDIDPNATAGEGTGRPKVVVAADGIATAVWGEGGHVYARRMFELRASTAPQRLDVDSFGGQPGAGADQPDIDTEDDSSFAWVVFRQALGDGSAHVLARRLRGSLFDDPVDVGPAGESGSGPSIDLNGRGDGLVGTRGAGTGTAFADSLQLDTFSPVVTLGNPSGVDAQPQPAIAEGGDGVVAWMEGTSASDAFVRARAFSKGKTGDEARLSNPDFGPVDPGAGFDAAANRAGDVVVVFVQGTGDQRRLVAGSYDRSPGTFVANTTEHWRNSAQPKLSWGSSFELWGPPTYVVTVDGQPVGQTTATSLAPSQPIADGVHRWQVAATDRRGQVTKTKTRVLRVDATAPKVTLRTSGAPKAGKTLTLTAKASDTGGSGVTSVAYTFGDGSRTVVARTVKHVFRRGTFTVSVVAKDRAGNVATVKKRIRVGKGT